MALSPTERRYLWLRAGGRCECQRPDCWHEGRCSVLLETDRWFARPVAPDCEEDASSSQAVCAACFDRPLEAVLGTALPTSAQCDAGCGQAGGVYLRLLRWGGKVHLQWHCQMCGCVWVTPERRKTERQ